MHRQVKGDVHYVALKML